MPLLSQSQLSSTSHMEENTKNRVPPVTQPKSVSKDEDQSNKQQKPKAQVPATTTATKKPTQKQEESFTVVGANRQKTATPPLQQQQQTKSVSVGGVSYLRLRLIKIFI